jgi:hypothetical protein
MKFRLRMKPCRAGLIVLAVVSLATLSATPALARPAVSAGSSALLHPGAARAASGPSPTSQLPDAGPTAQAVRGVPIQDLPIATSADFAAQPPVPDPAFVGLADPNTGTNNIPVNAVLLAPPSAPSAIQAAGVSSVFNGLSQGTKNPPSDSSAAGGPSNVLEQVNGAVAVYSRTGSLKYGPVTSATYYGVPSNDQQFDPHTIFDPNGKRFIAIMEDATKNTWQVSVSDTSDALSGRCLYTFGALNSGASSVDFPLVAVSPKYLMLTIRENGGGNRLVVVPLAQVEACQGAGTWVWANVQNPGGGTADTLVPVLDYNTADTYSYLVNSYASGGSHVSLYKFSDSGSSPGPLISANVSVPPYSVADPATQKGSSVSVDSGNPAITQAVNYTHGMYATLTSGSTVGWPLIMWLEFNPSTQTLVSNGLLYNPTLAFFDSSITEGANGTTMYTYALSGPTIYPSSAVVGMDINHNITTNEYVHQGAYPTPQSRWGDFTSTYTDYSVNTNAYWSASQFMADASHYGTAIAYGSA